MGSPAARPLRVVVADDESVARDVIRAILADEDGVEIVGEAASGGEAAEVIAREEPDLVLLDIRMPGMDGFEVLDTLELDRTPTVVFVTAHDEFAVRAFDVHALDYVLKPFGDRRLREAVDRARDRIRLKRMASLAAGVGVLRRRLEADAGEARADGIAARSDEGEVPVDGPRPDRGSATADADGRGRTVDRLVARSGGRRRVVQVSEIDWIESAGDYVRLYVGARRFLIRRTLKALVRSLDPRDFVRIHRSTVVNLSRVAEYHPISHGDYAVILHDGTRLRLSRTRRKTFLRRLRGISE